MVEVRGVFLFTLVVAGCLQSPLVPCGDLYCAPGTVCVKDMCASPVDVAACDGMPDGASCRASNGGAGTCEGGVCQTGLCGNGRLDPGEACDDGNQVSGDGCRADCLKKEVCGDGVVDQGEQCDDANSNPADGCDMCKNTMWAVSTAVGMEIAPTDDALAAPGGIASDAAGRLFIADTYNHRILRIEADGQSITKIAGNGIPGFLGDGGDATSAELQYPTAVAVDGIGRVFIADAGNSCIRRIDLDGTITTIAGTGVGGYTGDGGPAVLAQLADPNGVAVDGLGRVIIGDSDNNVIRQIDIDGTINTIAGTGIANYSGDGGQATNATLSTPRGLAIDATDRVIIADTANSVLRRIELDGTISTIAGNGIGGHSGDGGPATQAELALPFGVAVDATGRMYIADTFNDRIRVIDTSGVITTISGNGMVGFSGDGGPATSALLANPTGVALDAQGQVVIADEGNARVRRIDTSGTISTIAGDGTFGFGGDGGMATSAQLGQTYLLATDAMKRVYLTDNDNPDRIRRIEPDGTITTVVVTNPGEAFEGIAIDAIGRIFITDRNRVYMVDTTGTITTVAGDGSTAVLYNPQGLALDGAGGLVVADSYNHRIRRVNLADGTITTIAGNGSFGFSGDGGPAMQASMAFLDGIAVDAAGRVIFSDTTNNRIRAIESDQTISTIAGTGVQGFSGDGGPATAAQISQPAGIAIDPMGRIVFSDFGNHRVRRVDTNGVITTIAGVGTAGSSGDAGAATSASLNLPLGVAIDASGAVLIADSRNLRVRRIDPASAIITTIAGKVDPDDIGPSAKARLADPQALVVTPSLTLVAGGSSGTVEAIRNAAVTAVVGRYPQDNPTGALARFRTNGFGSVSGLAIDVSANLAYITETSSNRLHVVTEVDPGNPTTWTIAALANTAGTAGFADGPAATAQFRSPTGLYLDAGAHVLYIADTGNHAIRALDLTTQMVTTVVNTSHSLGFGGDGGPAAAALLYRPTALTRCPNGELFIADTGNNRVRRIDATGSITTVLGDAVAASSGEGTPARTFPVDAPRGVACDTVNNLFVTSSSTVRLLPATDPTQKPGFVDGSGAVQTIYGKPPRTAFPSTVTDCLTGIAVTGPLTLQIADACTGLLVQLDRTAAP
jgi:cysteine-rich repeat protein